MDIWDEKFKNHPIYTTLTELKKAGDLIRADDKNIKAQKEKRRLLKLIDVFEDTLKNLDPELVSYSTLDQIDTAIKHQNILGQLAKYRSSINHRHLINANNLLTNTLLQVSQILATTKRSEVNKPIKELEDEIGKISITLGEQNRVLKEISKEIEAKKQDAKTQIEEIIKNSTEKLTSEQKKFDEQMSKFIEEGENKRTQILKLHEIVAGDSAAVGYFHDTKYERKQANIWRRGAILFIALAAAWIGVTSFAGNAIFGDGSIIWGAIKSFSMIGVLLFGATYTAKESYSHRQNEKQTRWISLAIKAIDPSIASLSKDDQRAIKNKFIDRLFGQQHNSTERETTIMDEHASATIVKSIQRLINTIRSK